MKVLLAEAPFSYFNSYVKGGERFLPLGIAYIAAAVKKELPSVEIKTFVDDITDFKDLMKKYCPDVVGISAMTTNYPCCMEMAKIIKEINPSTYIVIGGQHVSSIGGGALDDIKEVDFICIGEGEKFFIKLLKEIINKTNNWGSIEGIVFRQDGKKSITAPSVTEVSLDSIPFPARELFDLNRFKSHDFMRFGSKTVSMISSRGCVFKCSFCSSFVTMGRKYRFRTAENVVEEIEQLVLNNGIDGIIFWDDAFTFKKERVIRFCELLKMKNIKIKWWCMSRVDAIDYQLAQLMADAGCVMISFGIESGCDSTLKRIHKNIKLDVALRAIKSCSAAGIRTQGTFIIGLPFETLDNIKQTINFALKSKLHMAIFFSFTPFPGTEEWQHIEDSKKPKNIEDWYKFVCNSKKSKSWNPLFSDEEIKHLVIGIHRKFYFRIYQVMRIARTIKTFKEFLYYVNGCIDFIRVLSGI